MCHANAVFRIWDYSIGKSSGPSSKPIMGEHYWPFGLSMGLHGDAKWTY